MDNRIITTKKAFEILWNPRASRNDKEKAVSQRPGVTVVIRMIQALIPGVLFGIAILVLALGFPGTWHWVTHNLSAAAQFVRYGIPVLTLIGIIGIGTGLGLRDRYYAQQFDFKKGGNNEEKIENNTITEEKIENNTITEEKIENNTITEEKMEKMEINATINLNNTATFEGDFERHIEKALAYIESPQLLNSLPHPSSGASSEDIYMLSTPPCVIRKMSESGVKSRIQQIDMAQNICLKNKLDLIVIPKICQKKCSAGYFTIEERVPCTVPTSIQGMRFYYNKREKFFNAVMQFTNFLCEISLDDLVGGNGVGLPFPLPRFDNVLIYKDKIDKKYKIALVDLQRIESEASSRTQNTRVYFAAKTAISLFPFHAKYIIFFVNNKYSLSEKNEILGKVSLEAIIPYDIFCGTIAEKYIKNRKSSLSESLKKQIVEEVVSAIQLVNENGFEIIDLHLDAEENIEEYKEKLENKEIDEVKKEKYKKRITENEKKLEKGIKIKNYLKKSRVDKYEWEERSIYCAFNNRAKGFIKSNKDDEKSVEQSLKILESVILPRIIEVAEEVLKSYYEKYQDSIKNGNLELIYQDVTSEILDRALEIFDREKRYLSEQILTDPDQFQKSIRFFIKETINVFVDKGVIFYYRYNYGYVNSRHVICI